MITVLIIKMKTFLKQRQSTFLIWKKIWKWWYRMTQFADQKHITRSFRNCSTHDCNCPWPVSSAVQKPQVHFAILAHCPCTAILKPHIWARATLPMEKDQGNTYDYASLLELKWLNNLLNKVYIDPPYQNIIDHNNVITS